jgi:hypothetical protein
MNRRRLLLGSLGAALAAGMTLPAHEASLLSNLDIFGGPGHAVWNRMLNDWERDALMLGYSPIYGNMAEGLIYFAPAIP